MMSTTGNIDMSLIFNPDRTTGFFGNIAMQLGITDSYYPAGKALSLHILPSKLSLNGSEWNVAEANIDYVKNEAGGIATINGFRISHDRQFVDITGIASASTDDEVVVTLREIDLDYIFDTLNINYVSFGGRATGEAVGTALLSGDPQASTTRLHVDNFSYNHSVLGDAEVHGDFDMAQKRVGISADVAESGRRVAKIDGGIWIGRDSLSFAMDADKVRIGFLQPFMSAFSSKVDGRASGKALLYGTFSDIDMAGRMMADTIALKVDYTNVTYTGRDSVIITPGRIHIPSFTLHDEYGNSARLSGELTHRYFHDPEFDFRISDARNLLVYDTNPQINPIWYGRIFGSGGGRILGRGNYVGVTADMTTQANSVFTFVLSDQEEAADYRFLTFTDRRLEEMKAKGEITLSESDEIVRAFKKKVEEQMGPESVFGMNIRATLTPATRLVLVMDPAAGDKITAHGSGAMNLTYRSDSDEMRMYGKYVLDEGTYNFSLQDVILKDFIIKRGSSISFNGDPMDGLLDIRAAYRVNTNLTDLDATFATDRDLNRTNVPVDAMLIVTGQMEHPEISFDIELPTLNDEVEQKVRSVIASEDMMNLQMIYLLALNRFYTPEYMGGTSGGEWASVASSTLSSQLANILGQLTDKVTVAPSFRSDKGDFSDLEVDLALSSRLFNNRLLINGNIGYRDPSTSNTTFVGDFDVEYLLNRGGNWRLKAYNHFNDQNYYLKSALTTQGVGIMWRRDFNHIFGHGKRRPSDSTPEAPRDSVE
ncbi:MAG: translocation/assembly module TamB [Muribaculaceae bacterium]|nr:translocation/assembly module TamB [Muribaculaceae bacterium]